MAQEIKEVTAVRLVYWRAFHGRIEQRLENDPKDGWYVATMVTSDDGVKKPTKIVNIKPEDILALNSLNSLVFLFSSS